MPTFNLLFYLNAYSDRNPSNSPNMQNFKWSRPVNGLAIETAETEDIALAPGENQTVFSKSRTLDQDGTTLYSITLKPGTTNTYVLSWTGGTAPDFRIPRALGDDASTQVNVTQNGPVTTFSAPALFASFTGQIAGMTTNVTITANYVGSIGNSVVLSFDGIKTVALEIADWNAANPLNTVTLTTGNGTQIPSAAGVIDLAGGATPFNLAGVQVGDSVTIGSLFNILNQSSQMCAANSFQIIAVTATSFSVRNSQGVAEGPITLGAGFATQIEIFGAVGVQVGDTLNISAGFSQATWGNYPITAVYAESLEFFSASPIPLENNIMTQIAIYESAFSFIYLEADQPVSLIVNGVAAGTVRPFVNGSSTVPGIFVRTDTIFSLSVVNTGLSTANVFMALVG
jgi:hypothetical protein